MLSADGCACPLQTTTFMSDAGTDQQVVDLYRRLYVRLRSNRRHLLANYRRVTEF